jgi:hypothetical protein
VSVASNTTVPESPPGSEPAPKPDAQKEQRGLGAVAGGLLAGLASQAALLTAILVYFGWVRATATYRYFGVDVSTLNFSVTDYVLRSVDAAFPLLVAIGLVAICAMVAHDQLRRQVGDDASLMRRLMKRAIWTGVALVLAGFILATTLVGPNGSEFWGPAVLMVGFALTAYGFAVRNESGARGYVLAIAGMTLVALLWTVAAYANYVGVQKAEQVQSSLVSAAGVTVYSASNLSLSGPGITMSQVRAPGSIYRFRYTGLRLLVSSADQYFLLPSRWRPGLGAVIVLPVSPSNGPDIRVEFTAP